MRGYTTVCLSIHQLMDIWVDYIFLISTNDTALNIFLQIVLNLANLRLHPDKPIVN